MVMLAGNTLLTSDQILLSYHHIAAWGAGIMFLVEGALVASMILFRHKQAATDDAPALNG
jgi:hypothetical protein